MPLVKFASTNQKIWVVTRHQYGISALVFQTSFRGDSVGGVVKCRLFSQATNELISYPDLNLFYTEKCGRSGYEITNESDLCYFIFQFNGMSGTTIFFPITIFFWENLKKNWPEERT